MNSLSIPHELRIGVTGHRDLPNLKGVQSAVDDVLTHMRGVFERAAESPLGECSAFCGVGKRCDRLLLQAARLVWRSLPVTVEHVPLEQRTSLRWVVVSPLAKGADRIVANAVLNQTQQGGQPSLQVVAPFALDDYRRDFVEPDDLKEFEELLARDAAPTILTYDNEPPQSDESLASQKERRNEGYYAAGRRVVDSCEILIVIWDGQPAAGRGGTAEIVQYAVEQGRKILWIDAIDPARPARQIVGHEPEKVGRDEGVVQGFLHRPLSTQAKDFSKVFHRLSAYNRDPSFDHVEYQTIFERNSRKLSEAAKDAKLPQSRIGPVIDTLLPHYARADQLAIRYQELYLHAAVWLQRLSSVAVSIVVVQVLFFPRHLWLILFEVVAMLLAVVLLRISRREAWHEKWLRDRHLAERLRIAMFTTLARSARQAQPRPDETLAFYQSTDDWIVDTSERLAAAARDQHASTLDFDSLKKFLVAVWLREQANYHDGNKDRKENAWHKAHRLGLAFFCVTMLMALLHLLGVGHEAEGEHHEVSFLGQLITALAIVLPAWGATVHSVNTLLERERISTRSAQMAKVLSKLVFRAEQASTREEFAAVINRCEELMLMENHEWWVSLSFHPPNLPS